MIKGWKYLSRELFFLSPKKFKKTTLCINFLQPQCKCTEMPQSRISKSTLPFSVAPSFSKISTPRSGSMKWLANIVLITTLVLRVSSSHVSLPLGALSLFKIFIDFSHQRHTSHRGWQKFSTLCLDYLKMHLQVKKLNLDIFCYVPQVLIITPEAEGDHSLRPESVFFLTPLLPSPSRKRGRRRKLWRSPGMTRKIFKTIPAYWVSELWRVKRRSCFRCCVICVVQKMSPFMD